MVVNKKWVRDLVDFSHIGSKCVSWWVPVASITEDGDDNVAWSQRASYLDSAHTVDSRRRPHKQAVPLQHVLRLQHHHRLMPDQSY